MSFDFLAPHYRRMEAVLAGARLQRCRATWFADLAGCRHLLVAGVGHGPDLPLLLATHPRLRVTCLDASPAMLAEAERRVRTAGADIARVAFVRASLPGWRTPERFDAIATHFFLDCFPPEGLRRVVEALAGLAAPDARWIVSDFSIPARGFARLRARAVHALMYGFFRVATRLPARRLTPPDPFLRAAGFALRHRRTSEWGLLQADLWVRAAR